MRSLASLGTKPVSVLAGVGEAKCKALSEMGIASVLDLLTHYPRRYIDRSDQAAIGDMALGEQATVLATVRRVSLRRTRQGRPLVEAEVSDGTGYMRATFFNQPWRLQQLEKGREVLLFGKLESFRGRRQMTNPVVDLVGNRTGRIVPVYPQSEKAGLTSWEIGPWVEDALRRAGELADPLQPYWRRELGLIGRTEALRQVHFPESMAAAMQGRRRLAFDELLRMQVYLVAAKRAREREAAGIAHQIDGVLVGRFRDQLPFALTAAQEKAIEEIVADLAGSYPMHRLLQGDVGSGKTVVAVMAMLVAVQGGHQAALMAPTEVLAEQHYIAVRSMLAGLTVADEGSILDERPVKVALLTGRTPAGEKARIRSELAAGSIDLVIGTHALLSEGVEAASLGVVVIDEQHRFGVEQRDLLRNKSRAARSCADPDLLVMTATPIPRTAAMTVFGDLDMTVMAELPAGRRPVRTVWARSPEQRDDAWRKVREEAAAGRRAYVVCPLVEGSEKIEATSAKQEHARLAAGELAGLRLGLLHGQMAPGEKESVMGDFRAGGLDVLVATTVIEVGVDVPDATVMVIQDADRFGIAQLHQLRGRVGRGSLDSWCYLFSDSASEETAVRLGAMAQSTDGFELAEVDLDLRGEGTILGTRQKGRNDLKLASLRRDRDLVRLAREVAFDVVDSEPGLAGHPELQREIAMFLDEGEAAYLFKS